MAPLTWILSFISYVILAESQPSGSLLFKQEHHRFHLIPKLPPPHFPHNLFGFGDFIPKDQFNPFKPFEITPEPLINQQNGDTEGEVHENNSNSVLKKVPEEENKERYVTEPSTAVKDITPKVNTEEIPKILEKLEDVKLSVKQPLQEHQDKELTSDSMLETAKVNVEVNTDSKSNTTDLDTKNKDPGLTKNTDYVLIPVVTLNQVPDQLNPSVGNSAYSGVVQNSVNQAVPVVTNEGIVPLSNMNQDSQQGNNIQPNQLGTVLPQNQNYIPGNNVPNAATNNAESQSLYVVPSNVAPSGNNVPNNMYYVINNPLSNNMGTQGNPPTPAYKLLPLSYQQNNQPNNMIGTNNMPNNYVVIPNQNNMIPTSNQPYLVSLNNQQNYPNGYIVQHNNPNSNIILPNNLNNQQYNPIGYLVQPNNVNNQQNNPNSYVILPNNLNNQQNNPNGYIVQPNNLNNLKNQPINLNSYVIQPNNLNTQPNNQNSYLIQPNNLNSPQNNQNSYLVQPNNLNNPQNNPNSYLVQPNNLNNPQNNLNTYLVQPNNMNNLNNQPTNSNGYSYQPNNLVAFTNQPNNLNADSYLTSNNAPVLMQTSDYNGNTAAIPLFSFKDKDEGDTEKEENKEDGVKELKDNEKDAEKQEE